LEYRELTILPPSKSRERDVAEFIAEDQLKDGENGWRPHQDNGPLCGFLPRQEPTMVHKTAAINLRSFGCSWNAIDMDCTVFQVQDLPIPLSLSAISPVLSPALILETKVENSMSWAGRSILLLYGNGIVEEHC
jgi:hypothetical protein